MSTGHTSSRYSWKSAAVSISVSAIGMLIVWLWFGRYAEESAERLIAQEKAQHDLNTGLKELGDTLEQTDRKLNAIESTIGRPSSADSETAEQIAEIKSWIGQQQERTGKLDDTLAASEAKAARHRSETVAIVHRGRQLENSLAELEVAAASWAELQHSLLASDSGRRIASSSQHLDLVTAINARDHVSSSDVAAWKLEFDELYAPVRQAESDSRAVFVADAGFAPAVQKLEQKIHSATEAFRRDTLLIRAIQRETVNNNPAEVALGDAIAARELGTVRRLRRDQFTARVEAQEAAAERVRQAEKDAIDALAEVDAAEQRRQAAERRAVAAGILDEEKRLNQEARLAEQKRKLELEYARELPEIRRLLHPFITPGIFQPSLNGFDSRYRPESMSLTAIATVGALEKSEKGLTELFRVGGSEFTAMRGLGSFPAHNPQSFKRDSSVRKRVERAQELLLKYGDLLVEKGILLD